MTAGKDRQSAVVAQLAEQPPCKRQVVSSTLIGSSRTYSDVLRARSQSVPCWPDRQQLAVQARDGTPTVSFYFLFSRNVLRKDRSAMGGFFMLERKAGEWHDGEAEKVL